MLSQRLRENAGNDVASAAGRERHDHPDGLVGVPGIGAVAGLRSERGGEDEWHHGQTAG